MADVSFFSPYAHDFVRIGVCTPRLKPADPLHNADEIIRLAHEAQAASVGILLFPELGISAYAVDDLHLQETLLDACERELVRIAHETRGLSAVIAVGLPLRDRGRLYNVAAVVHGGEVLGIVPKSFLPNYREFYEARWFTPGAGLVGRTTMVGANAVPFGADLLFAAAGPSRFTFHVEICEDGWVATPPSSGAALAGAEVLLNLSASNITIGKAEARRLLFGGQSSRCLAIYAYSAAGPGESTTDLAWDGHAAVFELGHTLTETARFPRGSVMCLADADVGRIRAERVRTGSFADAAAIAERQAVAFRTVTFGFEPPTGELELLRPLERFPYVPSDPAKLRENCYEAWNIQVQGVVERLRATGVQKLVIGVSGGLDSTEALVVAVKAMDLLGHPRANVLGYTMPGFGTSDFTKSNALDLMRQLGISAQTLDIRPAAQQMLADLGHPFARGEPVYDITFENVQAGLRTDYLFRLANQQGALVLGTGDLSELALGWCTYGVGDQMSHYNPNGGVSKTLIQHLIRFAAEGGEFDAETSKTLLAILDTEISPELIPADKDTGQGQSTEAKVGPYALQDFNLYYLTRFGFRPSKIAYLSWAAWHDAKRGGWPENIPAKDRRCYDLPTIKGWLRLFLQRFFANQFKRSALPNGPKISSGGSLSPRGDWRMPSDAAATAWLAELEANVPETERR